MAKPEWGTKRRCLGCAAKFYDFSRSPIVCPKCGAAFQIETPRQARENARALAAQPKPKPIEKVEEVAVDEPEVADDDAEEAVIEDTEELAEDVEGVIEKPVETGEGGER